MKRAMIVVGLVASLLVFSTSALVLAGNGEPPFCCNCLNCPPDVSACRGFETIGGSTAPIDSLISDVCVPLGCTPGGVSCIEAPCSERMDCPQSEIGQCDDGVDNDGDGLADCADSTCSSDAACGAAVPAMSSLAFGALATMLVGVGLMRIKARVS